ncbi:MAG: hypothetical protein AAGF26_20090 [Cyanobacteria bacterium P01_G01_bin.49]
MKEKTVNNINSADTQSNVSDVEFFGDCDLWNLICKASSKSEGWIKSTKAMEIEGQGCLVQVTTQQLSKDGQSVIAEAITFIPKVKIKTLVDDEGNTIGRKLVDASWMGAEDRKELSNSER